VKQLKFNFIAILVISFSGCFQLTPIEQNVVVDEKRFSELIANGIRYLDEYDKGDAQALLRSKSSFSIARDLKPSSPLAFDGLGSVAFRQADYRLAQFLFEKSIEKDEGYGRAKANLAAVHYREGRYAIAEKLLRRAVKLNALDHRAVNNLSSLLYNTSASQSAKRQEGELGFYKAREIAKQKSVLIEENIKVVSGDGFSR